MSSAISSNVDRSIDVGGAPVTLEVDDDHLVAGGEGRQDRLEHLARPEAAVQEDQRAAGPMDLVVEIETIHVGGSTDACCFRGPLADRHRQGSW